MLAATPPADTALEHAWDSLQAVARLAGERKAPRRPTLAAAAVFTVQDAPGHMGRLATSVAAQPAPVLSNLTLCGAGRDVAVRRRHAGARLRQSPTPRSTRSTASSPCRSTSRARRPTRRRRRAAASRRRRRARSSCAPRRSASRSPSRRAATMPAAGWPLVVYHHGTGGSMRSFISDGIAGKLASATTPAAVLGFDAVEHGARKGALDEEVRRPGVQPAEPARRARQLPAGRGRHPAGAARRRRVDPRRRRRRARPSCSIPARSRSSGTRRGAPRASWRWRGRGAAPAAVFSGAGAHLTSSLLDKTMPGQHRAPAWRS